MICEQVCVVWRSCADGAVHMDPVVLSDGSVIL